MIWRCRANKQMGNRIKFSLAAPIFGPRLMVALSVGFIVSNYHT